jgi:hypothetical protein
LLQWSKEKGGIFWSSTTSMFDVLFLFLLTPFLLRWSKKKRGIFATVNKKTEFNVKLDI